MITDLELVKGHNCGRPKIADTCSDDGTGTGNWQLAYPQSVLEHLELQVPKHPQHSPLWHLPAWPFSWLLGQMLCLRKESQPGTGQHCAGIFHVLCLGQTLEIYKAAHLSMVCVTGESTGNNIFSQKIGVACKLSHHSWKPQKEAFLVSGHVEQGVHQCSFLQLLLLRFLRGACSWKRQQRGQVRERLLQGDWETHTIYHVYNIKRIYIYIYAVLHYNSLENDTLLTTHMCVTVCVQISAYIIIK